MIDLLLINPAEHAYASLTEFKSQGLNCKVVITPGYAKQATFVQDSDIVALSSVSSVTTALAYGPNGQRIVEELSSAGKILLTNMGSPAHFQKRLQYYLKDEIETGTWLYELVSFDGRHVLSYAKFYNSTYGWKLAVREKQDLPFFSSRIEKVFDIADQLGVRNGPSQIYIDNEENFNCRFCFGNQSASQLQKHFKHIWPIILIHAKDNPKKATVSFYDWVDRNGSSKRFDIVK